MATIKTSIALYDGVTSPLASMTRAMNVVINSFEKMQATSSRSVDVSAIHQARAELAKAEVAFDGIESSIQQASQQQQKFNNDVKNGLSGADSLWNKFKGIAATVGGMMGLQKVVGLSDDLAAARSRLSLFVDESSLAETEDKIRQSALRSRADYMATMGTIGKLGILAKDAFSGSDEIIAFTELMNKNFKIGGASIQEQTAAMYQLTQAMASNRLQGDEFRSIRENAPLLAQSIETYMRDVMGLTGTIKDWSADGLITAEVIKNAMFASAGEIEERFGKLKMRWGDIWTNMKTRAIDVFEPILTKINDLANTEKLDKFTTGFVSALTTIATIAGTAFGIMVSVGNFAYDHWSQIEPVLLGVVAAMTAYAVAQKAVAIWTAINNALMKASPIIWIIMLIGLLVYAISKWAKSVGGLQIAWMIAMDKIKYGFDSLVIGLHAGGYLILDMLDGLKLGFAIAKTGILNLFGDLKTGALSILQLLVNGAIDKINGFISVLNAIPGVNIGLVEKVTFATTAKLENEAAKQARNAELADYQANILDGSNMRDAKLEAMKADARNATTERQAEITAARAAAATGQTEGDPTDWLQQIYDSAADTAKNTEEIKDTVTTSGDELRYLREIAERRAIDQYTTAEIKVTMNNSNNISSDMDIDGIVTALEIGVEDAMLRAAEGVHE